MTPDEPTNLARLLEGVDRPRPLPAALRHQLEEALGAAAAAAAETARPLDPALSERLSEVLTSEPDDVLPDADALPDLLAGIDRPRPLSSELTDRLATRLMSGADERAGARRRRLTLVGSSLGRVAGVAAAVIILAGTIGIVVSRGPGPRSGVTAGPASGPGSSAPAPRGFAAGAGAGSAGNGTVGGPTGAAGAGGAAGGAGSAGSVTVPAPTGGAASASVATPPNGGAPPGAPAAAPVSSAPTIRSANPRSGPVSGGTWVTIVGSGFTGATAVRFGTTAAATFTVDSDGQIRALSPAHLPGSVDIVVDTPRGHTAPTSADTFDFTA